MALPTNVGYGTITGQFLVAYGDGSDSPDQNPDGVPAKGKIFFTASPTKLLDITASPNAVTILPAVVECTLDASGYLTGPDGNAGVRLVATDDTDLNPVNWTWQVDFRITDPYDVPIPVASFSLGLPQGTTVDLTTVSPVPSAGGTYYIVGPQGPTGATGATGPQGPAGSIDNLDTISPLVYDDLAGELYLDWTATSLDDLGDVNAPTPANNDFLTWDSTPGEWVSTNTIDGGTA